MLVRTVTLTNTRAHSELQVDLAPGLNVLVGPNGAGKTTVLEAVALVLQGGVLRPGSIRDLIKSDEDFLRVELTLVPVGSGGQVDPAPPGPRATGREAPGVKAAAAYTRGGERRLSADGAELQDPSRWRESAPVRTFIPDDLRLIKGSPRRRREFLDALTGRADPAYRAAERQYEEALAQRNSLLRCRYPTADDGQLRPWETILAQTGALISSRRAARLQLFVGPFQQMHEALTGEPREAVRLVYRSNVSGLDASDYETRLAEARAADRQRTFTHLGPHRDDLRLMRQGLDMRDCASQGEQRAGLLALVLAEWEQGDAAGANTAGETAAETAKGVAGAGQRRPLLLLDDVMSELDEERRRALVATVSSGSQVVITTTDLRYFAPAELAEANVIEIRPRP